MCLLRPILRNEDNHLKYYVVEFDAFSCMSKVGVFAVVPLLNEMKVY